MALLAPCPGYWRDAPAPGSLVRPGDSLGWLEVLGIAHRLVAPDGAGGIVVAPEAKLGAARPAVDHGARLLTLDPEGLSGDLSLVHGGGEAASTEGALVYRSPSSGRFYRRPAPDKPNFVELGQVIERGQALGLLEVMKTFTRITYDDAKLPARATVVEIFVDDQQDLGQGEPILRLE